MASARLMAVSRSASAAATSASRLMRAISGRPILVMYSFLSRTSLMVNETTSSPILLMSSAQVARMRSPTISGSLTICSTESWPMMPRRWPSITRRMRPSRACVRLGEELLGRGLNGFGIALHFDLRNRFHRHGDALLGVEILLRRDIKRHQLQRKLAKTFDHREDHRSPALHDARAAQAIDNQRFMRTGFAKHGRYGLISTSKTSTAITATTTTSLNICSLHGVLLPWQRFRA